MTLAMDGVASSQTPMPLKIIAMISDFAASSEFDLAHTDNPATFNFPPKEY
jgi:hypothetical protein